MKIQIKVNYTEEKDSLSVRVAFVKVNIRRIRRFLTRPVLLSSNAAANMSSSSASQAQQSAAAAAASAAAMDDDLNASFSNKSMMLNDVKLSVIADIGMTTFVYDMRNIKEVFVFPKIWYRRSLARRVFLGEEAAVINNAEPSQSFDAKFAADTPSSDLITSQHRKLAAIDRKCISLCLS